MSKKQKSGKQPFPTLKEFASEAPFQRKFRAMKKNPCATIDRCQEALRNLEAGYRGRLYDLVALVYEFAKLARCDEKVLKKFYSKPLMDRCYQPDREKILWHAMQFAFDAPPGSPGYKKACSYARALESFFEADVPMEKLPKLIQEAGGLDKLDRRKGADAGDGEEDGSRPSTSSRTPNRDLKYLRVDLEEDVLKEILQSDSDSEFEITVKIEGEFGNWRTCNLTRFEEK